MLLLNMAQEVRCQIRLGSGDFPDSGDTIRYSTASVLQLQNVAFQGGGANQKWDFSGIRPEGQEVARYRSAGSVAVSYRLFFGGSAYGRIQFDSLVLGPLAFYDVYDFFEKDANSFRATGRGLTYNGLRIPATYQDDDERYFFPLEYGDRDSSTYDVSFDIPGAITLVQRGYRITEVDGWGQVITPFDTFDCLRVVTTTYAEDSIALAIGGISLPNVQRRYQWWTRNMAFPVMEVRGLVQGGRFLPNQLRFRDRYRDNLQPHRRYGFTVSDTSVTTSDTVWLTDTSRIDGLQLRSWRITPDRGYLFVDGSSENSAEAGVRFIDPGQYAIGIQWQGLSSSFDTTWENLIQVRQASSIHEGASSQDLRLHPMPATDRVYLHNAGATTYKYRILDMQGQTMLEGRHQGSQSMDVNGLEAGLYVLELWEDKSSGSPTQHRLRLLLSD